ncbi:MAG TPA: hypothetical protein VGN44_09615 [Candidatus Angelobacter sp.]|jgi:hypothetical protein
MKNATIALIFTASCFAQTHLLPKPSTNNAEQCTTVLKCRALIKATVDAKDATLAELATTKNENAEMQKQNADLKKKYDDSIAVLDVLATQIKGQSLNLEQQKALAGIQAGKALELGTSLEKDTDVIFKYALKLQQDYKTKSEAYDSLVDRYNATLQQANSLINNQNARLARQQQIYNALAIYSAMPRSQPYVLPQPPVFTAPANTNISCTSSTLGSQTYTNCH